MRLGLDNHLAAVPNHQSNGPPVLSGLTGRDMAGVRGRYEWSSALRPGPLLGAARGGGAVVKRTFLNSRVRRRTFVAKDRHLTSRYDR